jgi:DNA-binding transcriptional MerR regulator
MTVPETGRRLPAEAMLYWPLGYVSMATPKRDLFKAAEVCEVAEVQAYVLRSWEAEFPQLGQPPSGGGPRLYRRSDIEMVLRIKSLVFGEGLTLAGARRRLEETAESAEPTGVLVEEVLGEHARERVRAVRDGLRGILQMLSSAEAESELVLAAPATAKRAGKSRRRAG